MKFYVSLCVLNSQAERLGPNQGKAYSQTPPGLSWVKQGHFLLKSVPVSICGRYLDHSSECMLGSSLVYGVFPGAGPGFRAKAWTLLNHHVLVLVLLPRAPELPPSRTLGNWYSLQVGGSHQSSIRISLALP